MMTACYLADLMLLPSKSNIFKPSLIASSSLFIAILSISRKLTYDEINEMVSEECLEFFGSWFTQDEFSSCVDHVLLSWNESRHNPNFSRFDAVNNKYDTLMPIAEYGEFKLRFLQPPLISFKIRTAWFYRNRNEQDIEMSI